MSKNWIDINKNIRIFCKKVNDTDNKCTVLVEIRDKNNTVYSLKVPRSKIKSKKFHTYFNSTLLDFDIELTEEDIEKIKEIVSNTLNEPAVNFNGKLPLEILLAKMYQVACGFKVWFDSSMFVDKGCFYINAKTKAQLQKIINDYDSEWSQLEFKQQLKLHDLLITDKHQPYVKSVYSLGGATLTKGAAYKYLLIPVNKLKEFCKSMGAEISDNAKDTKKEDIA